MARTTQRSNVEWFETYFIIKSISHDDFLVSEFIDFDKSGNFIGVDKLCKKISINSEFTIYYKLIKNEFFDKVGKVWYSLIEAQI